MDPVVVRRVREWYEAHIVPKLAQPNASFTSLREDGTGTHRWYRQVTCWGRGTGGGTGGSLGWH